MTKEFNAIVEWCMQSLANEPEAWTFDCLGSVEPYYVKHRNGVRIWLANRHYGMGIEYDDAKVGGVTGWSSLFGPLIPWRRKLRRAALSLHQAPRGHSETILNAIRGV